MKKPQPERDERQKAIDAFRLANGFVGDLLTGARILEPLNIIRKHAGLDKETEDRLKRPLHRMVYYFLVITLTKYLEWYARFKDIIPRESREGCERLYVKLSKKFQLRKLRNKVVAHIIDEDTGKPLTPEEVNKLFQEFVDKVGEDLYDSMTTEEWEKIKGIPRERDIFCFWVDSWANSQRANPEDIVNTIEKARDAIRKRYNLTDEELFPGPLSS